MTQEPASILSILDTLIYPRVSPRGLFAEHSDQRSKLPHEKQDFIGAVIGFLGFSQSVVERGSRFHERMAAVARAHRDG